VKTGKELIPSALSTDSIFFVLYATVKNGIFIDAFAIISKIRRCQILPQDGFYHNPYLRIIA
jgi:hypothetical protein